MATPYLLEMQLGEATDRMRLALTNFRGTLDYDYEYELYRNNIQIGADGSILRDGDHVYVLCVPLQHSVTKIEYFHDFNRYAIMAETTHHMPLYWHYDACDMIPLYYWAVPGNLTKRIIAIQRLWRRTWKDRHHNDLIDLALFFSELYETSRREGIIIPSLDYDQKVASRIYGGEYKRRRAVRREAAYIEQDCSAHNLNA